MSMGGRRRQRVFGAFAAALVIVACAGGASGPRLSLVSGPAKAEVGKAATVVVSATRSGRPLRGAKVSVWIRGGGGTRSFATRAAARGRFSARVVFPSAGRWILGA